jgi:hypothetical protein
LDVIGKYVKKIQDLLSNTGVFSSTIDKKLESVLKHSEIYPRVLEAVLQIEAFNSIILHDISNIAFFFLMNPSLKCVRLAKAFLFIRSRLRSHLIIVLKDVVEILNLFGKFCDDLKKTHVIAPSSFDLLSTADRVSKLKSIERNIVNDKLMKPNRVALLMEEVIFDILNEDFGDLNEFGNVSPSTAAHQAIPSPSITPEPVIPSPASQFPEVSLALATPRRTKTQVSYYHNKEIIVELIVMLSE